MEMLYRKMSLGIAGTIELLHACIRAAEIRARGTYVLDSICEC